MNEDAPHPPDRLWPDHAQIDQITTIVGYAQLLRRWSLRAAGLADPERARLLHHLASIEQAAWALHLRQDSPADPSPER